MRVLSELAMRNWSIVGFGLLLLFTLILSVKSVDLNEEIALDDLRNAFPALQSLWVGNASDACSQPWTGLTCSSGHITQLYVPIGKDGKLMHCLAFLALS
jgi:hypothetical protein